MNIELFEEITNRAAVLIRDDAEIKAFCIEKLGSELNQQDNTIFIEGYEEQAPFFIVTKGEENHFENKERDAGERSTFSFEIVFVGDFSEETNEESKTILKAGTKTEVNGIKTFTPSDTMRRIARMAGNVINSKIGCLEPLLMMGRYTVFSEGFYDTATAEVASYLKIELYLKASNYN